jgi:RNA polymerase sigma-70 factor (ECF subfamily)
MDSETQIPGRRVPGPGTPDPGAPVGGAHHGGGERPSPEELEKVRSRDREALGRFFDRYFDRIHGLACRLLGDRPAAEDVAQEVFLKVYRACDRLDPARDPWPWLVAITCNACREHWRGRHVRASARAVPLEDVVEREADPEAVDDPAASVDRGRRAERVQRALAELPPPLREVVVLHDWRGHSHQEIAEMLGATYVAIRKRYSRALAALGTRLREGAPA